VPKGTASPGPPPERRSKLLRRPERRQALISAAARAFARKGFAATSLEDVAAEAGVTRVLIYRHFDTKADLYRAVLDDVSQRLIQETGGPDRLHADSIAGLLKVAQDTPDAFRLYFRQAALEPEFRGHAEWLRKAMRKTAEPYLRQELPEAAPRRWAAELVPTVVIEAIISWLDAGSPQRDRVAEMIAGMVAGVTQAIAGPQSETPATPGSSAKRRPARPGAP
jgi:AcrR family transcriptional regulator